MGGWAGGGVSSVSGERERGCESVSVCGWENVSVWVWGWECDNYEGIFSLIT